MNSNVVLLSLIVFLPALGGLVLAFFPRGADNAIKTFSLAVTLAVFAVSVYLAVPAQDGIDGGRFDLGRAEMQNAFNYAWIPSFNIDYFMGVDGISFTLVLLTTFVSVLAMGASWPITKHVKAYCILYLLLETGILGVFVSLDFFLFYVFWEVMLLPMYFLIGIWGGPRREYAAIKFFLYTLLGGVLMLIAILMLYFQGDLVRLAQETDIRPDNAAAWEALHLSDAATAAVTEELLPPDQQQDPQIEKVHTFNLLALMKMGQETTMFTEDALLFGQNLQWWAFLLLFIGFAIKVPAVPLHTWLPDAHVEAPTPISMILAGVLLKLGGYGIIRICYPICPEGGYDLRWFVCTIGVVSMVYGAFAAMAQKDFKRLVAYSSVSHMGYVVLGIGVWSAAGGNNYLAEYWQMGVNGAMFQMLAHGISSAGMFFMVGVLYDRVHHRNLDQFGGIFARMPYYSGLAIVIFFAGLGLPGLCGFIGEVYVTLSVWNFAAWLAVVAASVVVLTAGYILWTVQRVYLGPEYKGPHGDHLHEISLREVGVAVPLVVLAIYFGVNPQSLFSYMTPSVNQTFQELADLTPKYEAREAPAEPAVAESAVRNQAVSDQATLSRAE
jgi:NADH-quinone oxidoreductase subunit M